MMWSSFFLFFTELFRFLVLRGYEAVKFVFHQGYRDGRKRIPPPKHKFLLYPATKLAQMIQNKELTSETLVRAVVERIREVDPLLHALVDQRFDDALEEARNIDQTIESGSVGLQQLFQDKPFLGVPFTVKDCISVTGLLAEVGSEGRKGYRADSDAVIVERFKKAGAIALAITNVPEMCLWIESSNHLHGRTNNPFDLHRTCGGSSGGEGALVSSCASVWGIGSDIAGSIRLPSAWCGLFGHKPTPQLITRHGLVPDENQELKSTIGVVGPMTRSTDDMVAMLKIIADNPADFRFDEEVDASSLKYYFCDDEGSTYVPCTETEVREQVNRVVKFLESELQVEVQPLPEAEQLTNGGKYWLSYTKVNKFGQLKKAFTAGREWQPLIELFKHVAGFSQFTLYGIIFSINDDLMGKRLEDCESDYREYELYKQKIYEMLGDNGVLILPSSLSVAPFHHGTLCSPTKYFGFAGLINVLKLPATVVPMGLSSKGLPLSVQIVAGPGNDRLTLAVAKLLENRFGGFVPPFEASNVQTRRLSDRHPTSTFFQ